VWLKTSDLDEPAKGGVENGKKGGGSFRNTQHVKEKLHRPKLRCWERIQKTTDSQWGGFTCTGKGGGKRQTLGGEDPSRTELLCLGGRHEQGANEKRKKKSQETEWTSRRMRKHGSIACKNLNDEERGTISGQRTLLKNRMRRGKRRGKQSPVK